MKLSKLHPSPNTATPICYFAARCVMGFAVLNVVGAVFVQQAADILWEANVCFNFQVTFWVWKKTALEWRPLLISLLVVFTKKRAKVLVIQVLIQKLGDKPHCALNHTGLFYLPCRCHCWSCVGTLPHPVTVTWGGAFQKVRLSSSPLMINSYCYDLHISL